MVAVSRLGAARVGSGPGDPHDHDDDGVGVGVGVFGDSGRFGAVSAAGRGINWPTVLVSSAVAAVVSSLFLALGVVAFQRSSDQPAEVVVAVEPRGAVSVDGARVGAGPASSSSSDLPPGVATPSTAAPGDSTASPSTASPSVARAENGGGLSPATSAAPATPAVPAPGHDTAGQGDAAPGEPVRSADAGPAEGEHMTGWTPPGPLPADFAVTTAEPTLDDLNAIVHLLVATPADDAAKARNLEAGTGGVVVPQTVYKLGIFRAPQGWKRITGPVERAGDSITATLNSESAGRPSITTRVVFVQRDGVWKLSTRSVCEGVRTVGLPIACGG